MTENSNNFVWEQSPGKRTCKSSEGLTGQIKTLKTWEALVLPGSKFTACKGNCDCRLIPTIESITSNPFSVVSPGGEPVSLEPLKFFEDGSIRATIRNEPNTFGAVNPDNSNVR